MSRKKCCSIVLVACLLLALAAAGRNSIEPGRVQGREIIEISVAMLDVGDAFLGDGALELIEDRLGIEFVPMNITGDDYTHKIRLWAEKECLPDLFFGDFRNDNLYIQWIEQGLVEAIPEDLSQYPYLDKYLGDEKMTETAKWNGRLYCIPRATYPSQEWTSLDRQIFYRWDLAQQAGIMKEPQTWQEFQEMILAIMEKDPEETGVQGMTARQPAMLPSMILPYCSPIAADDGINYKWVKDDQGVYQPAYFAEDMLPAFQLARDLYVSGVIEKDILLTTQKLASHRFLHGESAAILSAGGWQSIYEDISKPWEGVHGSSFLEDVKVFCLPEDKNGNKAYPMLDYAWSESYICAGIGQEKQERILELYDFLLSREGQLLAKYGVQGECYEEVDGGIRLLDKASVLAEIFPSCSVLSTMVCWDTSIYSNSYPFVGEQESYRDKNWEIVEEARSVPVPVYYSECQAIIREKQSSFEIHIYEDFMQLMTGTEPVEEMWERMLGQYQEEGLAETVQMVNDAMDKAR